MNKLTYPFFILFILYSFSKELLSFDVEKIIGLCVLTFALLVYYTNSENIANSLKEQYTNLNQEFKLVLYVTLRLLREVKRNWRTFYRAYNFIKKIFYWSIKNLYSIVSKWYNNRKVLILSIFKDELFHLLNSLNFNKKLINLIKISKLRFSINFDNVKISNSIQKKSNKLKFYETV